MWLLSLALLLGGCKKDATPDNGTGLLGDHAANPFPTRDLIVDGHVDLSRAALPETDTPLPTERQAWRTGFSPSQVAVIDLPDIDGSALPGKQAEPGEGSVALVDLTAGVFLPTFAELDAFPDAERRALLVRPRVAMAPGHDIAVVVTTAAVGRPDRFDDLIDGTPPSSLKDQAGHYKQLVSRLVADFGFARGDIALAFDFPIGDGRAPIKSALKQAGPPGRYGFDTVRDADDGDGVPPRTWRIGEGWFEVDDFLLRDELLDLSDDGTVTPTGTARAELYVHVPESVRNATPGTVPVLMFGHGIFSNPENYLDNDDDTSAVVALADAGGFIVVGTIWRGLTYDDLPGAVKVAGDFGQFPLIGDRLVQGQVNATTLARLVLDGDLLDDPLLQNANGDALADDSQLYYYGISLGSIQGSVLLGHGEVPLKRAALHVGGCGWSTMLERSSNWTTFETIMLGVIPDAVDRQRLYATSQLFWDPTDPCSWTDELSKKDMLYQVSVDDEQVPNFTSETFARSVGLKVLQPSVYVPQGLDTVKAPTKRAYVQFDPQKSPPDPANRPAAVSGAHGTPRTWPGASEQVIDWLLDGRIDHYCDPRAACARGNTGD